MVRASISLFPDGMRTNRYLSVSAAFIPSEWSIPSESLELRAGEIHLWLAQLPLTFVSHRQRWHTLDHDEQARALQFYRLGDRCDFIAAHAILRQILARYLRRSPIELQFSYGAFGKPELRSRSEKGRLHFNMSHSDRLALYAVTRRGPVGVDIERVRPAVLHDSVPEAFFSVNEAALLRALPQDLQLQSFFSMWTRKEAYAKARGEGLWNVLGVPLEPFRHTDQATAAKVGSRALRIQSLRPGSGYVAALAADRQDVALRFWRWNESDLDEAFQRTSSNVSFEIERSTDN